MDNPIYDRQKTILLQNKAAIVVGCGGTGFWAALFAAMSGCPELTLFDDDHLEVSNFNRLPFASEEFFGQNKAEATKAYIERIRPDCQIICEGRATPFTLSMSTGEVLFDCTDNQTTQQLLSKWAKENNRTYIRCGYDGTHFTVTDNVPAWNTLATPTTGYEIIPSWVVPAAIAAAFAVAKAMYQPSIDISADLGKNFNGGKN